MKRARNRALGRALLATLTGAALVSSFATPAMADQKPDPISPAQGLKSQPVKASKISPRLASASGQISVFVQFTGQGAFDRTQPAAVKQGTQKPLAKAAEVRAIRASINAAAQAAAGAARATTLYTTTNTIPGVALRGDAAALRALAQQANVVKITPLVTKKINNKGTDIDTRALDSWVAQKQTGEGTTIAVIDTGLDYTHTDFGGSGTKAAFDAAKASPTIPAGSFDAAKFAGGYDLVGDDYDADPGSATYQPVPKPDANPLDCNGHGSHVAGTAAGYGVNSDGSTFTGDYGSLTSATVNAMRIGPGSAPKAKVVALRVFGCDGSSDVVASALDRVLDPNGDGDFSDRAQIVNMSLGSDWSPTDDPENAVVDNLTDQNILSVVASGNAGDSYDIGGSPGNAKSSLTVANSIGSQVTLDRVDVLAPAGVAGQAQGQYSVNFDYNASTVTQAQLTGTVVLPPGGTANRFGCQPFPAGSLTGKWVWLVWEENGAFPCGSVARFNNAAAAGAKGVVLDSPRDVFDAGISGNATIPGVQLNRTSSDKLRAAATAGTLQVRLSPDYIGTADGPSGQKDQLNASSSRGVHGSNGIVKPDVAAAGTLIGSAAVGSGNKPNVKTGTSMATPHVAGIAALVRGKYPFLTATQTKALVMNTANRDVVTADGTPYGPNRVGSGRVDAIDALTSPTYAYAANDPTLTSISFGVLEVATQPVTVTKNVTVRNNTTAPITYAAAYRASSTVPGVVYSVPASVAVPAAGSATVPVTMTIADPKALAKTGDPSLEAEQGGLARQFIAEAAGRLTLTAAGKPTLRVPVHASVKPASAMSAGTVSFGANPTSTLVPLSGRGNTQTGFGAVVGGFQLGASSTRLPASNQPQRNVVDLQYVGANSSVPAVTAAGGDAAKAGLVNFGISTWANNPVIGGSTEFDVEVDTNGDGTADFLTVATRLTDIDLPVAATYAVVGGQLSTDPVDLQAVNGLTGETDTNTMDTNAFTLPVAAAAYGVDLTKSAPIQYRVSTYNGYSNAAIDTTSWISYNLTQPNVAFGNADGSVLFSDVPNTGLPAQRAASGGAAQALFLHLHNATGDLSGTKTGEDGGKAQVVPVTAPAASKPSIALTSTLTAIDPAGVLWAYPADGNGGVTTRQQIGKGWQDAASTSVVDWTGDGVLDIVATWKTGGQLTVYPGLPGGGFAPRSTLAASGWGGKTVLATQWTRTGRPGILAIESNGDLRYYPNTNGVLGGSSVIGRGWTGFEISDADWDKDGSTDLLARKGNGDLAVYRSNGAGGFVSEARPVVGRGWTIFSSIVARPGFTGSGSLNVFGIDRSGQLRNYPVVNKAFGTMKVVGTGWTGYRLSE